MSIHFSFLGSSRAFPGTVLFSCSFSCFPGSSGGRFLRGTVLPGGRFFRGTVLPGGRFFRGTVLPGDGSSGGRFFRGTVLPGGRFLCLTPRGMGTVLSS
ncbi:MAG: hypothetical protein PHR92_00100 [Lachnospiraceae bacterium]|nr:hypothetical protein [Lachnospiraceae bacterium]